MLARDIIIRPIVTEKTMLCYLWIVISVKVIFFGFFLIAYFCIITIDEFHKGKKERNIHIYYKFIDKGYSD